MSKQENTQQVEADNIQADVVSAEEGQAEGPEVQLYVRSEYVDVAITRLDRLHRVQSGDSQQVHRGLR